MSKKTRINNWEDYRNEIETNEYIDFSIINSNEKIKKLIESINLNVIEEYKKAGFYNPNKKNKNSNEIVNELNQIEKILNQIEKNENVKIKTKINEEYNSHTYDDLINKNFFEFINNDYLTNQEENIETAELKINKINIDEIK